MLSLGVPRQWHGGRSGSEPGAVQLSRRTSTGDTGEAQRSGPFSGASRIGPGGGYGGTCQPESHGNIGIVSEKLQTFRSKEFVGKDWGGLGKDWWGLGKDCILWAQIEFSWATKNASWASAGRSD